jgi:hypothetical protein
LSRTGEFGHEELDPEKKGFVIEIWRCSPSILGELGVVLEVFDRGKGGGLLETGTEKRRLVRRCSSSESGESDSLLHSMLFVVGCDDKAREPTNI